MRRLCLLLAVGCAEPTPDDQICVEIEAAVATRAETCWGDTEAAYEFAAAVREQCLPPDTDLPGNYACPFVLRNLACETAVAYGPDVTAWLDSAPTCALVVSP